MNKPSHLSYIALLFIIVFGGLSSCSTVNSVRAASNNEVVILAHGLGRSASAMWQLENRLEDAGYEICLLDYESIGADKDDVLRQSTEQIERCLLGGRKTHFVGHSLGGLVIKYYLSAHPATGHSQQMGEVVFMGTPNKGSEVADWLEDNFLMDIGGNIAASLMTGNGTLGSSIPPLDLEVGVIAGTKESPFTRHVFNGKNDGLVSVESANFANMKDMIVLDVRHGGMRRDKVVASQLLHFLRYGKFDHDAQVSD